MPRSEVLTVPNLLTFVRLGMVPVFVVLLWAGEAGWALICFAGAALTDWVDGLLARLLDQQSKLGALLDPVADKALVFAALSALVLMHKLPYWLWAAVLLRDLFLAGVAWAVKRRHEEEQVRVKPSRVGKYATFSLSLLVVLVLLHGVRGQDSSATSAGWQTLLTYTRVLTVIAGLAVAVSAVQYFARFGRLLFRGATRLAP